MKQSCDTCEYWKPGDLSKKNIGNVGPCVWMLSRSADFYDHTKHAPFWAAHLTAQTASFDGQSCGVYKRNWKRFRQQNPHEKPKKAKKR
jgi:hypothetical protein